MILFLQIGDLLVAAPRIIGNSHMSMLFVLKLVIIWSPGWIWVPSWVLARVHGACL